MINLIAAIGKRGQIGLAGKLPWHIPEDLAWFKQMTQDSLVIVGHKTYQTVDQLQGSAGRVLMVDNASFNKKYVLDLADTMGKEQVWIAGGAKTYARWQSMVDRSFIAHVDYDGPADTFYPGYTPFGEIDDGFLDWDPLTGNRVQHHQCVDVILRNGDRLNDNLAAHLRWDNTKSPLDIIKYRVSK